jgi:hypothetical protein
MPSIKDAIAANQARIASGGETGTGVGNPQPPAAPVNFAPTPAQDQPAGAGLPQRGMFPANLVLASDRSDSSRVFRGASMRSGTFPYQSQQIKTAPITVTSVSAAAAASTLALETNYLPNPNQNLLNLVGGPGVSISANPDGSVVISGAGGDGLTHGTLPWESDPGFTILRDDFFNVLGATAISGTFPASGIGELGWALLGNTGGQGGMIGGVPPYIGQYGWSNAADVSQLGVLTLAGSGSFSNSNYSQLGWALMDNPGWVMSFVFKVEAGNPLSSDPIYSSAQKSIYVGLFGQDIGRDAGGSPPVSRPNFFMGLRYDTSTTAPSIDDSFFTFEVVENPVGGSSTRNNAQGVTQVTSIAPVPGTWHRLDIFCSAAGTVVMMLDGANTFTATIPTFAITASFSGVVNDGFARLNWSVSGTNPPQSAWNTGSTVIISGFGAGSGLVSLNGTWQLTASEDTFLGFDASGVANTTGSGMATVTGYPSWIPGIWMGNDDTVSPTANNMMMVVDFFSFIWNPNLGPNAPGTPDATLPRYF